MKAARVWVVVSGLAMAGGLAAFAQPQAKQPAGRDPDTGKFYEKYHITQSDDGRRVYLWGFNSDTGELTPITHEDLPEDINEYGHRPGNFRDYFFAEAENGRRIYVWGYNPGEARFRLVSTAGALPDKPAAQPKPKNEPKPSGPPWQQQPPKRN